MKPRAHCLKSPTTGTPETYDEGRNFGHLAYRVDNIYAVCQRLMDGGRNHQPAATGRTYGFCSLTRRYFHRASARGRQPAFTGALGIDGKYWQLVI